MLAGSLFALALSSFALGLAIYALVYALHTGRQIRRRERDRLRW